jgi:hypothetical protein
MDRWGFKLKKEHRLEDHQLFLQLKANDKQSVYDYLESVCNEVL